MTNQTNLSINETYAQITHELEGRKGQSQRPANAVDGKQLTYLIDLRKRFNISVEGVENLTRTQARKEIEELSKRPAPASPRQMEIINETILELNNAGMKINISADKMSSLTGGREGTASKMIEFLFSKRSSITSTLPITDGQLDVIVDWFHCPDVPFESVSTETVYAMKEGANMQESKTDTICINRRVMLPEISEKAWRNMTADEFRAELKEKLTQSVASKFIDEHRAKFYDWKRTRATANQIGYIRRLDEQLARVYTAREISFAVDMEGTLIEVEQNNSRDRMQTVAHEPLSDHDLSIMSYDDASRQINQMKVELEAKYEAIEDNQNDQQELSDKMARFSDRYGTGEAKSIADALSKEMHDLQDFIYKLEAMVGSESPELHEMVSEVYVLQRETPERLKKNLSEFMQLAVDTSSKSRLAKTYGALLQACEDVPLALELAEAL